MTEPKREEERPCAPCTSAAGGEIWHGPLGCPHAMAGASDPLVASLDEIRRNLRVFGASDDEAARLLAAVEAVLKLADEWETKGGRLYGFDDRASRTFDECAEGLRETISSALTGKEGNEDGH